MNSDANNNLLLFPLTEASGQQVKSDTGWSAAHGLAGVTPPFPFVAVDYETYYTSKYSLGNLTTWQYVHHGAFDPYLVALRWWTGKEWLQWVGHPKDAPWQDIGGIAWASHNAGFDELVHLVAMSRGMFKATKPLIWYCTADMTAYMQAGRSLKAASKNLLNREISKEVREKMKFGGATESEMKEYAAGDARDCADLFSKYFHKWPEDEVYLSIRTRRQGWKGLGFDRKGCVEGIAHLTQVMQDVEKQLPWYGKGPVTSYKCYCEACHRVGILPAESLAADSTSAAAWEDRYGDKYPWISLMRRYNKARQTRGSLELFLERSREDDTIPFSMVYCKAMPTRRWQHAEQFRLQNLDAYPCEGVQLRHMIRPRPGYKFAIADLNQIEPRVLNWLAGCESFLEECRKGRSPYEAHARASMGYTDPGELKKVDPQMYALSKVRVLALGYGAGPFTFAEMAQSMCGMTIFERDRAAILPNGDTITVKQLNSMLKSGRDPHLIQAFNEKRISFLPSATEAVRDFRDNSTEITRYWKQCEQLVKNKAGGNYTFELPSGHTIKYFDITNKNDHLEAWVVRNSENFKDKRHLYGGKIVENLVQGESRNVLANCMVRIEKNHPKLCRIVFSVHDEVIVEVPEQHAEEGLQAVLHEMNTAPPWASGLPVAAEGDITDHYLK